MFADLVAFDSVVPARRIAMVVSSRVVSFGWLVFVAMALPISTGAQSTEAPLRQPNYSAKSWFVEDGLPHNVVNRIAQDGRGFLWVATAGGLARFDGREFKEFPVSLAPAEASLNIRDLTMENPATLLMLPASGGVVRLRDDVFSYHPATAALAGKTLRNLFVEPNGTLWLCGPRATLMRWQEGRLVTLGAAEHYIVRHTDGRPGFAIDGDGRTWIACGDFLGWYREGRLIPVLVDTQSSIIIAAARSGGIWVATSERLLKWEDDRLTVVCDQSAWLPGTATVQNVLEDRAGVVWVGTSRHGLFRLVDGKPIPVPTDHYQVRALTEDVESNLWLSMDGGGIGRLRPKNFTLLNSASGLPDDNSTSVCEDAAGAIWCADRRNGLVRVLAGQTRVFASSETPTPINASNICPDRDDNIWIGSLTGLYQLPADRAAPIRLLDASIQPVRSLYCTRGDDMWVGWGGESAGGFHLGYFHLGAYHPLSAADGFMAKQVIAITEAADGAVWIGAYDGEVLEYRDGRLVQRVARETTQAGHIHALHFDASGALWIATEHGLILKKDSLLRRFTRDDGLPDDLITHLLEDNRGRLWLCSRRGFFSVAIDELKALAEGRIQRVVASTFGKDEGLQGFSAATGGQPTAWKTQDGRLWFVTHRAVVGFDPEASRPERPAPSVYVDEALVDDRPVSAMAPLHVPPGGHRVEFRVVALNYSAPEKVRLRHRLIGFDQDWIETGAERSASYVQLPPGNYSLQVIAANQDGRWNEKGATLALVVAAAWWQTWWFRGGAVLAFTGLVVWLARYWSHRRLKAHLHQLEREHALEQERSRIARDLHDELGGRVTQIGMLADRLNRHAAPSQFKDALRQLAWRTRSLAGELESIVWTVSPKNNAWNRLAAFVAQFAQRFFRDTPIVCSVEGVEGIPPRPLAPEVQHHVLAVVKEALNNVLKHSGATSVELTLAFAAGVYTVRIRDNGAGFDPSSPEQTERNGLANMRTRAAEIGGTLVIDSVPGRGAELTLSVPECASAPAALA